MSVKRSIFRTVIIILFFLLICRPIFNITSSAVGPVDTSRSNGSIALSYKWNDEYILHDVSVHVYKIASIDSSGAISLTSDFEDVVLNETFPDSACNNDNIYNQQQQANALTLYQYAQNNSCEPILSGSTDSAGKVFFDSLQVGVYLISGDSISYDENYRYDFSPFFVCLPYCDNTDTWKYSLTAYPKCTRVDLSEVMVKNRIIKSWAMGNSDATHPQEIKVQIFKDNNLFDEITMSSAQNWIYEWTVVDDFNVNWSVKEINISKNYTVIYNKLTAGVPASELGTNPRSVFTIINKYTNSNTSDNPNDDDGDDSDNDVTGQDVVDNTVNWIQTGDVSSIAWFTALLSGSGMIVLLLGIRRRVYFDKNGADNK